MDQPIQPTVQHRPQASRFELETGGQLAVLAYHLHGGTIIFTHTSVPSPLEGQGIGSRLARAGLEYAREAALRVVPLCPSLPRTSGATRNTRD